MRRCNGFHNQSHSEAGFREAAQLRNRQDGLRVLIGHQLSRVKNLDDLRGGHDLASMQSVADLGPDRFEDLHHA